jgi:calcineurin-like phosphoesterase family protein
MSIVWVTSDWHLGHKNIARFRSQVSDVDDNTNQLINNYNQVVKKRDIAWFLGDMAFDHDHLKLLYDLPGEKRIVIGNHDTDRKVSVNDICLVFDRVYSLVSYKKAWLSHAPIHPDELRGKINIHGHTHNHSINDWRYFNACVDQTNMFPVKFQHIIEWAKRYERTNL